MFSFKAPLRDINFAMNEVLDYQSHYTALENGQNATPEIVDAILNEAARFSEEILWPLYRSGDIEGCTFKDGVVKTPKGYQEAYQLYCQSGWQGMDVEEEYGGQNLPNSLLVIRNDLMMTANFAFASYPGLGTGCMNTIRQHGTEEQKNLFIPNLASGIWGGTMCLTEPHCGTDLGQIKTLAKPDGHGNYSIKGTKIFITGGEHDLTDNIIHIVLARLPDAPKGTRGISLFLVPKFLVNKDGSLGERNNVHAGSIEHKMGLNASATCVMNFDDAVGYMIGEPNKGLEYMFTFMNTARIGTAIQGVGTAEIAYQCSRNYALERRSMRALSGKKELDQVADSLIYHGDVRRMLLTQRAFAEGSRVMLYHAAKMADHLILAARKGDQAKFEYWDDKLGFLTPILKGCITEWGVESAHLGIQVYGGHGYIRENGMEQIYRDARIATIYEGTTGIQSLDFLGRKILMMSKGKAVIQYTAEIAKFCGLHLRNVEMRSYAVTLLRLIAEWNILTTRIMLRARKDRDLISCISQDYLMYAGYITLAYFWMQSASVAAKKLKTPLNTSEKEFYEAKLQTASFYFDRILPRTKMHAENINSNSEVVMGRLKEQFSI